LVELLAGNFINKKHTGGEKVRLINSLEVILSQVEFMNVMLFFTVTK